MSGWYAQQSYQDKLGIIKGNENGTIAQYGCFLTAFCNLMRRFGKEIDPPSLNRLFADRDIYLVDTDGVRDDLGWASIVAYDGSVHVVTTGNAGWPNSSNAIVKFHYLNSHTNTWMDHFCLIADIGARTIVDSWDGVVKQSPYGNPVAYAIYEEMEAQPVSQPQPQTTPNGTEYTVQPGDFLSTIADRFKVSYLDIAEHNGIPAPYIINPGEVLHIPINSTAPIPTGPVITYESFPAPAQMRISKDGGAEKWAFGNVKGWGDFVSTAHVAQNTNFEAVGKAIVPVGNDTAAYYMDALAFGDFATSGKVANTVGFSWADVADGFYTPPAPPAPVAVAVALPPVDPLPPTTPAIEIPPTPAVMSGPNAYKTTYSKFGAGVQTYYARRSMMVHEFDNQRPDRQLLENQRVDIDGTFIQEDLLYGRPAAAAKNGFWFGIPMTNLRTEDELLKDVLTLTDEEKKILHPMTGGEYIVNVLSTIGAFFLRLFTLNKKKN